MEQTIPFFNRFVIRSRFFLAEIVSVFCFVSTFAAFRFSVAFVVPFLILVFLSRIV